MSSLFRFQHGLILLKRILTLALALAVFQGCEQEKIFKNGPSEYDADVALDWLSLQLNLTQTTPGFTPPVAARAYGYTGLALYEAMVHGMEGFRSMEGQISDYTTSYLQPSESNEKHHWGLVANSTLAAMLRGLYPTTSVANQAAITDLERSYNTRFNEETTDGVYDRSVSLGARVAQSILDYASTDGQSTAFSSNFPSSYVAPAGPGLWEPTPSGFQPALQPYWGNVRPFLAANVSSLVMPTAPTAYSVDTNSAFYAEAMEVYQTKLNLTAEQEVIAKFWSDDPAKTPTPSGHSMSIMKQVLEQENAKLDEVAVTWVQTGMAVHDAFVCCWKTKYTYNYLRPVTAIQDLIDASWTPILNTPPFPEYPSGHSVQSGAACAVLTGLFGDNYAFTDRTHENRTDIDGSPRSFSSFEEFAMEAAMSRLYGGIHFMKAITEGVDQGVRIGSNIQNLKFRD
jgi:hypothetical protein